MKKQQIPKMAMSVVELGQSLGLSRPSAYALAGRIGVKVGGRLLVPVARIEALLARPAPMTNQMRRRTKEDGPVKPAA